MSLARKEFFQNICVWSNCFYYPWILTINNGVSHKAQHCHNIIVFSTLLIFNTYLYCQEIFVLTIPYHVITIQTINIKAMSAI